MVVKSGGWSAFQGRFNAVLGVDFLRKLYLQALSII